MSHQYLCAGKIFENMNFMKKAVSIAEKSENISDITVTIPKKKWSCNYKSGVNKKDIKIFIISNDEENIRENEEYQSSPADLAQSVDNTEVIAKFKMEANNLIKEIKEMNQTLVKLTSEKQDAITNYIKVKNDYEEQNLSNRMESIKIMELVKKINNGIDKKIEAMTSNYDKAIALYKAS